MGGGDLDATQRMVGVRGRTKKKKNTNSPDGERNIEEKPWSFFMRENKEIRKTAAVPVIIDFAWAQ